MVYYSSFVIGDDAGNFSFSGGGGFGDSVVGIAIKYLIIKIDYSYRKIDSLYIFYICALNVKII